MKNKLDKDYQALLQDILDNGHKKSDRTGTGTISVFGRQIRHKMADGFPILTTKKMGWKQIVVELIWFLNGNTNIRYLIENNCHIWDGDCYKAYIKKMEHFVEANIIDDLNLKCLRGELINQSDEKGIMDPRCLTKAEFIEKIKTDDKFMLKWGDLGPIYGQQWRSWGGKKVYGQGESYFADGVDQISNIVNYLKRDPDSRRLMVNAWNVSEIDNMTLPPCHYGYQFYTRELSVDERLSILTTQIGEKNPGFELGRSDDYYHTYCNGLNIPKRAISLMWNQRSVDTFLGLPFNISSYGLLLVIIAKIVNMVPEELIGNLGDTHLYLNHIDQANEQIARESYELPSLELGERFLKYVDRYTGSYKLLGSPDFGYYNQIGNLIATLDACDFTLNNYQSHSKIDAPLSN